MTISFVPRLPLILHLGHPPRRQRRFKGRKGLQNRFLLTYNSSSTKDFSFWTYWTSSMPQLFFVLKQFTLMSRLPSQLFIIITMLQSDCWTSRWIAWHASICMDHVPTMDYVCKVTVTRNLHASIPQNARVSLYHPRVQNSHRLIFTIAAATGKVKFTHYFCPPVYPSNLSFKLYIHIHGNSTQKPRIPNIRTPAKEVLSCLTRGRTQMPLSMTVILLTAIHISLQCH